MSTKIGFEVTLQNLPIGKGQIDTSILDLFKWKEAEFDKNLKFIILNYLIEQMEKSKNPIEKIGWQIIFKLFQNINEGREPNNLILPKGMEVNIKF